MQNRITFPVNQEVHQSLKTKDRSPRYLILKLKTRKEWFAGSISREWDRGELLLINLNAGVKVGIQDVTEENRFGPDESRSCFAVLPLPQDLLCSRHAYELDRPLASAVELLRRFSRSDDDEKSLLLHTAVKTIGRPVTSPIHAQRPNERTFDDYFGIKRVAGDLLPVGLLNLARTYAALMPAYRARSGAVEEQQWLVLMEGFNLVLEINLEYLTGGRHGE